MKKLSETMENELTLDFAEPLPIRIEITKIFFEDESNNWFYSEVIKTTAHELLNTLRDLVNHYDADVEYNKFFTGFCTGDDGMDDDDAEEMAQELFYGEGNPDRNLKTWLESVLSDVEADNCEIITYIPA